MPRAPEKCRLWHLENIEDHAKKNVNFREAKQLSLLGKLMFYVWAGPVLTILFKHMYIKYIK